jgi:uncharacterized metal-binding protein YceD (DUF177 family)
MKYHREFEIPWFGLKEGIHEFRYEVNDKVIEELGHEHPDMSGLETSVVLKFDKKSSFFLLHFDIDGKVDVACDRCGDTFSMRLWDEFDMVVKLTGETEENEEQEEEEADVAFIPRSETVLDVSGWIYEFIMLSIPMQHIHPDKEDGTTGCNPEALKLLEKMSGQDEAKKTLWAGLDKFKDLDSAEGKN